MAATVLICGLASGCADLPVLISPFPFPSPESTPVAPTGDAATALAALPLQGRDPRTGGQDTSNDVQIDHVVSHPRHGLTARESVRNGGRDVR